MAIEAESDTRPAWRRKIPTPVRKLWRAIYAPYMFIRDKTRDRRERLQLWLEVTRGGSYLTWYAKRLNRMAQSHDLNEPRIKEYLETGDEDLTVLMKLGLKPYHRLFEFGVGHGRSSQFFAEYLEAGNFVGNDSSSTRLSLAEELIRRRGLQDKKPRFIVTNDNSADWLPNEKFDFIWSNAVFTHMPEEDVETILANLGKILTPDGQIVFTFVENSQSTSERLGVKDWYHSKKMYDRIAHANGYEADDLSSLLLVGTGSHFEFTRLYRYRLQK